MNNIKEKDTVICISEKFPLVITTEEDKSKLGNQSNLHPKKGEVLTVDEVLGDFLMFEKYNNEGTNWFHYSRFRNTRTMNEKLLEELSIEFTKNILLCKKINGNL